MEDKNKSSNWGGLKILGRGFKDIWQWLKAEKRSLARNKEKVYPRNYSKKELENLIDECGKNVFSHINTSENLAKASLGLNELQRRTMKRIALFLTAPAVVIAIASFFWAVHADNLSFKSNELSLKLNEDIKLLSINPQIDVYIKRIENNNEKFILGIENNGIIPIINLTSTLTDIEMNKKDYRLGKENGFSMSDNMTSEKILEPSDYIEREILFSNSGGNWVKIIYFDVSFQRKIDGNRISKRHIFFLDGHIIYNLEDAKNIEELKPVVSNFRKFIGNFSGFQQKIYSQ